MPPARLPRLHASARALRAGLRALGGGVAALVYPPLCLGCERRLADPGDAVCPACLRDLPRADDAVAGLLADAPIDRALVLWTFDPGGTVRRLQHALKYGGRPRLGRPLGRMIGAAVAQARVPVPDLVVSVPLSRLGRLERGYNQADALAAGVAEAVGAPFDPGVLVRTRATQRQAKLSRQARRANVDGAFAVAVGRDVRDRRVLLVDDVVTTGATIAAAARPLAEAGATVDVAALAIAGD